MIEITRKCNLKCAHCLRGDAQNITMSKEVIDKIFEDTADCKSFLFTGGEPLLALDEIEYFVDKILKSYWTTSNITMTINGTIRDKRLVDIANKFCKSKEGRTFHILVSEDEFHDNEEGKHTIEFYQKLNLANGVIVVSQLFSIRDTQKEFTLAGRAIEYYKNHPQLDSRWVVKKEEQTNHRLCILNDRIPCAMYVTALGGFESYVGEDFATVDRLSYGSILQSSMTELIDNHNNACLISCHDAYMINYYRNLSSPEDFFTEALSRVYLRIFERFITAREKAKRLYPLVTTRDIMIAIPFPDFIVENRNFITEMISVSENLTDDEIKQYADLDLVNNLSSFENKQIEEIFKTYLRILALMNKPKAVIAPNKIYGTGNLEDTPEFKKLAALNHKYQVGELMPDNTMNFRCEAVYGKSFRDYEVEKIQDSDLPDEIKISVLRKEEQEQKIVDEFKKFCVNFIKDFKEGLQNYLNDPNYNPITEVVINYIEAQKNLQYSQRHENKSSEQMPSKPTWKFDSSKVKRNPIRADDGLRCYHCGKVIQDEEGHNIHCKVSENGLQCQYCKTINLIERGDLV